jgi:hypothetical protein
METYHVILSIAKDPLMLLANPSLLSSSFLPSTFNFNLLTYFPRSVEAYETSSNRYIFVELIRK